MTIDARPGAMDIADDDDGAAGDGAGWGDDDELVGDDDDDDGVGGGGGAGSEKGAGWGDSDDDLDLPPDVAGAADGAAFAGGDDADGFYVPPTKGVSQAQVLDFRFRKKTKHQIFKLKISRSIVGSTSLEKKNSAICTNIFNILKNLP